MGRGRHRTLPEAMKVRKFIRPDITVSAVAHLSALALLILYTEVHPFGTVTAEPITVDLVSSEEVPKQPDPLPTPTPTPTPQLPSPDMSEPTKPVTPIQPQQAASPLQQQQPQPQRKPQPEQKQPTRPDRREVAAAQPQSTPQAPPPAPSPSPSFRPPEP